MVKVVNVSVLFDGFWLIVEVVMVADELLVMEGSVEELETWLNVEELEI